MEDIFSRAFTLLSGMIPIRYPQRIKNIYNDFNLIPIKNVRGKPGP